MLSIIVNRVIEQLMAMLEGSTDRDPTFETSNREWSRRIWLSYHIARKGKPLRSAYFLTPYSPLMVSLEAGDAAERAWLMEALQDVVGHRKPEGVRMVLEDVLYSVRAVTGRERFIWPTNKM